MLNSEELKSMFDTCNNNWTASVAGKTEPKSNTFNFELEFLITTRLLSITTLTPFSPTIASTGVTAESIVPPSSVETLVNALVSIRSRLLSARVVTDEDPTICNVLFTTETVEWNLELFIGLDIERFQFFIAFLNISVRTRTKVTAVHIGSN